MPCLDEKLAAPLVCAFADARIGYPYLGRALVIEHPKRVEPARPHVAWHIIATMVEYPYVLECIAVSLMQRF